MFLVVKDFFIIALQKSLRTRVWLIYQHKTLLLIFTNFLKFVKVTSICAIFDLGLKTYPDPKACFPACKRLKKIKNMSSQSFQKRKLNTKCNQKKPEKKVSPNLFSVFMKKRTNYNKTNIFKYHKPHSLQTLTHTTKSTRTKSLRVKTFYGIS